jgi:hypothetical protein
MNQLKYMTKGQKKPYRVQMTLSSFGPVSLVDAVVMGGGWEAALMTRPTALSATATCRDIWVDAL